MKCSLQPCLLGVISTIQSRAGRGPANRVELWRKKERCLVLADVKPQCFNCFHWQIEKSLSPKCLPTSEMLARTSPLPPPPCSTLALQLDEMPLRLKWNNTLKLCYNVVFHPLLIRGVSRMYLKIATTTTNNYRMPRKLNIALQLGKIKKIEKWN